MPKRPIRFFRRSRKFVAIWCIVGVLAGSSWFISFCSQYEVGYCEAMAARGVDTLLAVAGFVLFAFGWWILWKRRMNKRRVSETFRYKPWLFDKKFIQLTGQVKAVYPVRPTELLKRLFVHFFRKLTADENPVGRFPHQVIIVSSPQVRRFETILVLHNTEFGTLKLRSGDWVEIRGQYLHRIGKRKTFFGLKHTFYGKIHFTHPPRGYVRSYDRRPPKEEIPADVHVV